MNTTASFHSETSWSRRCSTETVFSVQGKETDFVQDSSDTELGSGDDKDVEYEPATETEEEAPISGDSSGDSDDELIANNIVIVRVDDGDLQLADSEAGSYVTDSELDLPAYWRCARCRSHNDNTRYRYCRKCFQIRKNFFPPRPRRKDKRETLSQESIPCPSSQDSGFESLTPRDSQESIPANGEGPSSTDPPKHTQPLGNTRDLKRRAESAERTFKRPRLESESDIESSRPIDVAPLVKTVSDPSVTIESLDAYKGDFKSDSKDLCIICLTEPKSGVFVHRRVAHICCCYKCAVKVWSKAKRCPICNCKVSNVLKAVIV